MARVYAGRVGYSCAHGVIENHVITRSRDHNDVTPSVKTLNARRLFFFFGCGWRGRKIKTIVQNSIRSQCDAIETESDRSKLIGGGWGRIGCNGTNCFVDGTNELVTELVYLRPESG